MNKRTIKIPNERTDDLRAQYDVDYSKSRPNPYVGRVAHTHGGKRAGAGRKAAPEPLERHTITLYKTHAKFLRGLDTNLSRAIRKLIVKAR
jgi:hypothetical protein